MQLCSNYDRFEDHIRIAYLQYVQTMRHHETSDITHQAYQSTNVGSQANRELYGNI